MPSEQLREWWMKDAAQCPFARITSNSFYGEQNEPLRRIGIICTADACEFRNVEFYKPIPANDRDLNALITNFTENRVRLRCPKQT